MSLARRESLWAYAFITPWTLGFLIFTVGPMLASLFFSFTSYDIVRAPQWIGLNK
jgi:multiple sugar transport system permease protein